MFILSAHSFTLPISDPTWIFFMVLGIILLAPMVFERLRIPAIVGLILAGVLIGPYGLSVLDRDASFELFGKVGIYYIMFLAALEMNLQEVEKIRFKALGFGLLTFIVPFVMGIFLNHIWLGYALGASVLMASMYASHTLLPYPLVMRYGVAKRLSVNLSVGGTIVADTLTLIVLAVVGGMYRDHVTGWYWAFMGIKIILISIFILFTFPRISRWFFRKFNDGVVQYIFILSLVFLGAGLMESVGMEGILGAFLVGIALNKQIPSASPLMTHIEFVGNAIFIPYFLIGVGMLINLRALTAWSAVELALLMVGVSIVSKWIAALLAQKFYHLTNNDRWLVFGLTNARAAATLAIVLVGYNIIVPSGERLFNEDILNGVMVLILVTSIIASFASETAARRLAAENHVAPLPTEGEDRIVIAISNPDTVEPLVHLSLLLRTPKSSSPFNAVNIVIEGNEKRRLQGLKDLERAAHLAAQADVRMFTHSRWSVNVISGLSHSVKELDASDLVVGLHEKTKLFDPFFGRLANDMIHALDRQILVYRHFMSLNTLRRIHIVVPKRAECEPSFGRWADRVALLAERLSCKVEIYSEATTLKALQDYWQKYHASVVSEGHELNSWNSFVTVATHTRPDHLVVFVWARPGHISRQPYMDNLPTQIEQYFSTRNLLIIFPADMRTVITETSLLVEH